MSAYRNASNFRSAALAMRAIALDLGHLCSGYVAAEQVADRGLMPSELNQLWSELVRSDPDAPAIGIPSWDVDEDGVICWTTGTGRLSIKATEDSVTLSCWAGTPAPAPVPAKSALLLDFEEEYWGLELLNEEDDDEGNLAARVIYDLFDGQWVVREARVNEVLVRGREDRISHIAIYDAEVFDGACRQHLQAYAGLFGGEEILLGELTRAARLCDALWEDESHELIVWPESVPQPMAAEEYAVS